MDGCSGATFATEVRGSRRVLRARLGRPRPNRDRSRQRGAGTGRPVTAESTSAKSWPRARAVSVGAFKGRSRGAGEGCPERQDLLGMSEDTSAVPQRVRDQCLVMQRNRLDVRAVPSTPRRRPSPCPVRPWRSGATLLTASRRSIARDGGPVPFRGAGGNWPRVAESVGFDGGSLAAASRDVATRRGRQVIANRRHAPRGVSPP